jgi:hypothetical protein
VGEHGQGLDQPEFPDGRFDALVLGRPADAVFKPAGRQQAVEREFNDLGLAR